MHKVAIKQIQRFLCATRYIYFASEAAHNTINITDMQLEK